MQYRLRHESFVSSNAKYLWHNFSVIIIVIVLNKLFEFYRIYVFVYLFNKDIPHQQAEKNKRYKNAEITI